MPTAARMVAAILYAGLAWYVSQLIKPLFPEGTDVGWFAEVNAGISFFCGWVVAGSRAGTSWPAAISYGLTTTFALLFWCLFLQSFADMVRKSMRNAYSGPAEAVTDVFGLIFEYGMLMSTRDVLSMLFIGGVLAGLVTEIFGRSFR